MKYLFQKRIHQNFAVTSIALFIFLFPSFIYSATISVYPQQKEVAVGEVFNVSINLNSENTAINASSLDIKYDPASLSIQNISHSNSIFVLWTEKPTYSNSTGLAHFSGGLFHPGWNGTSGNLVTITFKAKASGQTKVTLQNPTVLANDGIGTNVFKHATGADIKILESKETEEQEDNDAEEARNETESDIKYEIPLLESVPDTLTEGDILTFRGKGLTNGQVQVYIQKGKKDIEIIQINTDKDGVFDVSYKEPVLTGYYKVWARNISEGSMLSTSSDIFYIEVVKNTSTDIFGFEISHKKLVGILLGILVLLSITLIFKGGAPRSFKNSIKN